MADGGCQRDKKDREKPGTQGVLARKQSRWLRSKGPWISDANVLRSPQRDVKQNASNVDLEAYKKTRSEADLSFIHTEILPAVIKVDEVVPGKTTEREKQKTKDRCLRSTAIFSRAVFYIVQKDGRPDRRQKAHKTYQIRQCPILHVGKFTVYPKEAWGPILLGSENTSSLDKGSSPRFCWPQSGWGSEWFRTEVEGVLNPNHPRPKCQGQLLVIASIPRMC